MSATDDRSNSSTQATTKRTVLYGLHVELGGKMVDFAGWEMPVQYPAGIMAEHKHSREKAALFDVSHMGQLELRGSSAAQSLESLVPADIQNLPEGHCRYTFFTNADGGILDDLIVTNAGNCLYVVVNASMRDQDIAHLRSHLVDVELSELTEHALIAIQGPAAIEIVASLCPAAATLIFMQSMQAIIDDVPCRVSRLGYTGEDGFELSIPNEHADRITRLMLNYAQCMPAGLGARDSLRLEAGLCLYGNDIDQTTTPIEASLTWAIPKRRREQGGFPGDSKIIKQISHGASRKLVGISPAGRAPARQGTQICDASGAVVGMITSGGFGPTLSTPIAMGYVDSAHAEKGTALMLSVRGKLLPAQVSTLPFVSHNYKR